MSQHQHADKVDDNSLHSRLFAHVLPDDDNVACSAQDKQEEDAHFATVLSAFADYETFAYKEIDTQLHHYSKLSDTHKKMLPMHAQRIALLKAAANANYNFLLQVLDTYRKHDFAHSEYKLENTISASKARRVTLQDLHANVPPLGDEDLDKVRSTLKQFVRDWSEEGAQEREHTYGIILQDLQQFVPKKKKVLTPGAGLGRLTFEIARLGYASQGNEFSFYMLLAANFVLNQLTQVNAFTLYPFIHQRSNILQRKDQIRGVQIPDINTSTALPKDADFSMVAGDFVQVYGKQANAWDAIVTCYFVDTAKNVLEYVETIKTCLAVGGVWINYGPLLYHFENSDFSIELSYDELRQVIVDAGFEMKKEQLRSMTYATNKQSMFQVMYKCAYFVAVKK